MPAYEDDEHVDRTQAPLPAGPSCSRCGNQLYPEDRACPNCGQAIPGRGGGKGWGVMALAGIVLIAAGIAVAFGVVRLLRPDAAPPPGHASQRSRPSRPQNAPHAPASYDEEPQEVMVSVIHSDDLKRGITLEEVNAILGIPGRTAISISSGSRKKANYKWEWDDGRVVEGTFEGGLLVGLSVDGSPQILGEKQQEPEATPDEAALWVPAEN